MSESNGRSQKTILIREEIIPFQVSFLLTQMEGIHEMMHNYISQICHYKVIVIHLNVIIYFA